MAFQVCFTGSEELSRLQLLTDVRIERNIYDHSRADLTLEWDDGCLDPEGRTAEIAARLLNCKVDLLWRGCSMEEKIGCFHGYVEQVASERRGGLSRLQVSCVTESQRADLVPHYRAFQATTLLAICQQIMRTERLFKIGDAQALHLDIPLSLQHGETDYAYLGRMLRAHGIPMAIEEKTGEIYPGTRTEKRADKFPDSGRVWNSIRFLGAMDTYPQQVMGSGGPSGLAQRQVETFNRQLNQKARDYFTIPNNKKMRDTVSGVNSQVNTARYELLVENRILPFTPGEIVEFNGHAHIIRQVRINGRPQETRFTQEFVLQPYALPFMPERSMPVWPSRMVWAHITANEHDPTHSGRVQVEFEWEPLDPHTSGDRAWLQMVTPYGGGKSPAAGKAGEYNGLHSVPEVGERVLVEFIGNWDSEAIVMGTVREKSVNTGHNPKETKRWRTPSGNEVVMTTQGGTDILTMKTQDKLAFQSKIEGGTAEIHITPGESADNFINFKTGAGPPTLTVMCGGIINMTAQDSISLSSKAINLSASNSISLSAAKTLTMTGGIMTNLSSGVYLGMQGAVIANLTGPLLKINGGIIRMDAGKVDINAP